MRRIPRLGVGRIGKGAAISAAVVTATVLAIPGGPANASAGAQPTTSPPTSAGCTNSPSNTMFTESQDIATMTPPTNKVGDPIAGQAKNVGGEAVAVFDVNGDGVPDLVFVNGSAYYFVALGVKHANGSVTYAPAQPYLIGVTGDGRISIGKSLGLTDFNNDGKLDLYVGNTGDGTLGLKNPRNLADTGPDNLDTNGLPQDHRYRSYINNGNGTFTYQDVGADAQGDTRSALFADFDGDGKQDLFAFSAPYFGAWWDGSPAPTQLLPGQAGGTFGSNILTSAVVDSQGNPEPQKFEDAYGRGDVDFKGAVVRDFDGDGKPDVIASAYSDMWDGVQQPPLAAADPAGAYVDLNGDHIPDGGFQGGWPHGVLILHNVSTPGHIKFQDVSDLAMPDEALGYGDKMDAYETIPVDINGDGKLDLVVTGVRDFTAADSLEYQTPVIQVYLNESTLGHLKFKNITAQSGLDFMNNAAQLSKATNGLYPISIPGEMEGGGPLQLYPNLSAGAAVDINNDGRPDIVLIDRQFVSRNPLTGQEFAPWVFLNDGNGKFTYVPPSTTGLVHTAREISYGDLSGDGRESLVMENGSGGGQTVDDNNYVFTNQVCDHNDWVDLKVGTKTNPLGLGARVDVYAAGTDKLIGDDEMRTDFAYRSKRDAVLHFGLGQTDCVDVRIDGLGRSTVVHGLRADQLQQISIGSNGQVTPKPQCGQPSRGQPPHHGSTR